jgi:hypothetical protein
MTWGDQYCLLERGGGLQGQVQELAHHCWHLTDLQPIVYETRQLS